MNLYLISQDANDNYDTYDSAVVCAPDEETARNMDPCGKSGEPFPWNPSSPVWSWKYWARSPEQVSVKYLGVASEDLPLGVVCASFNAG